MAQSRLNEPDSDIRAGIGEPALRAFTAAGYTRLNQLARVSEDELLKLHGVGPKAIRLLRVALETRGLPFARIDP